MPPIYWAIWESEAGTSTGKTKITVTPALTSGNSYKYKAAANPTIPEYDAVCTSGYTAWNGTDEITATTGQKIVIVEVDSANKAKKAGIATITAVVNNKTLSCTVRVTSIR